MDEVLAVGRDRKISFLTTKFSQSAVHNYQESKMPTSLLYVL